jgi:hypothetical protein
MDMDRQTPGVDQFALSCLARVLAGFRRQHKLAEQNEVNDACAQQQSQRRHAEEPKLFLTATC